MEVQSINQTEHVLPSDTLNNVLDCTATGWQILLASDGDPCLLQLTEARSKLQDAINESHPMPSANYLRQAAAACLRYGLRSAESGLQLTPVLCAQVSKHIYCPDENDIMKRLQRSTCIKFLQFPGCPDHFLLDLQAIILPRVLSHVKDFVASIRVSGKRMHPEHHQAPQPPDQIVAHRSTVPTLPAQVVELHM